MQQDETAPRPLHPVKLFAERYPAFTEAAQRALIYASKDRVASGGRIIKGNGLEEAGAIVRIGRRVLIDEQAFFRWVAAQQGKSSALRGAKAA